jgi:hypothetical protein
MHSKLAFHNRPVRTGLAVLGLAALALSCAARLAHAATITISDQASCEAAGGEWDRELPNGCLFISPYTVNAGDSLQLHVQTFFESNLTNTGTLHVSPSASVGVGGNATNSGIITLNGRLRINNTLDNAATGRITVNNLGELQLFGPAPVLNNEGVVTITSGGELDNEGTVNNNNLIEVACGGSLSGTGTYTGTPVQTSACPPDADHDGVPDEADACLASDLSATVVIEGCDSRAENDVLPDGCTIADLVTTCLEDASTPIRALLCITRLTKDLRRDGALSAREAVGIVGCTVRSLFPDED